MTLVETQVWVRVALALVGAVSIYLGYRLFCDLSPKNRLTHLFVGALLAIFGLGILFADSRSVRTAMQDSRRLVRKHSAQQGSFEAPNSSSEKDAVVQLI